MKTPMAHKISAKERTDDVTINPDVTFDSFGLKDKIRNGLIRCGYINPSPVQLLSIPEALIGIDLVIQAKSGTGKTVVFAVTALQTLTLPSTSPQVLIIAPTREIASQIAECISQIGRVMDGLAVKTFIGGVDLQVDKKSLKTCNVVVGTPGRIKQLLEGRLLKPSAIRLLVLDEADKLMEEHFVKDVNEIFGFLPQKKQMIASSATYPDNLSSFLTKYMCTPKEIRLGSKDPSLLGVTQYYSLVGSEAKRRDHVVQVLDTVPFSQAMIFYNNREKANSLLDLLIDNGHAVCCIAGDMTTKERSRKMEDFKTKNLRALISTDLCSRGIDAENVDLVLNLDIPFGSSALETYFHRIGRSGRFGSKGTAITVLIENSNEAKRFFKLVDENDLKVSRYPGHIQSSFDHEAEYRNFVEQMKEDKDEVFINSYFEAFKLHIRKSSNFSLEGCNMSKKEIKRKNREFVVNLVDQRRALRKQKQSKRRKLGKKESIPINLSQVSQAIFPVVDSYEEWEKISASVFSHFLNPHKRNLV